MQLNFQAEAAESIEIIYPDKTKAKLILKVVPASEVADYAREGAKLDELYDKSVQEAEKLEKKDAIEGAAMVAQAHVDHMIRMVKHKVEEVDLEKLATCKVNHLSQIGHAIREMGDRERVTNEEQKKSE